jgi:hypothetical protein
MISTSERHDKTPRGPGLPSLRGVCQTLVKHCPEIVEKARYLRSEFEQVPSGDSVAVSLLQTRTPGHDGAGPTAGLDSSFRPFDAWSRSPLGVAARVRRQVPAGGPGAFEPGGALAGILSRWMVSCQASLVSLFVAAGCACYRAPVCRLTLGFRTIAVRAARCGLGCR